MTVPPVAERVKPLDFGAEGITGSLDHNGRLIALNHYHPRWGYVTLTTADPFPEHERYNPTAVRAYRASLAGLTGFGFTFPQTPVQRDVTLLEDAIPRVNLTFAGGSTASVTTLAAPNGVLQIWNVKGIVPRWRGRLSLQRCAYTQLTEGGPLPPPPVETRAHFEADVLTLENPALGWSVAVAGLPESPAWQQSVNGSVEVELPGQTGETVLSYGVGLTPAEAVKNVRRLGDLDPSQYLRDQLSLWHTRWSGMPTDLLVRRGLVYGLAMGVPVGDGICFLTDHMLLPLSWNRDAYYIARALLSWRPEMADVVRRHLVWMFEQAERPHGVWGRCYLANGQIKDPAFQLDQQLFPLLELADYTLHTGDRDLWQRCSSHVTAVIETLLARKAAHATLFPTDETPADDPVVLPYHLSSHILFWYTLKRLSKAGMGQKYAQLSAAIRESINRYFTTVHPGGHTIYAYATDGRGQFHFYHDANDFPLALAPAWGLLLPDDPVWRATLDFAFSPANEGGAYGGRLGSVHTRAPWPLGDVQDMIIARALGDAGREQRAWDRLHSVAQSDGALTEASDVSGGRVVSRHWFAWPNAALACVVLGAFAQ